MHMGGRGSFSGLGKTIDEVLGLAGGYGPVDEINADEFKTLEQTEDLIRGRKKEVLVVFDSTGKAIKAYQGERDHVSFPVEEAQKWKGCTVTHNHPKGYEGFGGTLSFADVRNSTVYNFKSHRAVSNGQGEKNYVLIAKDNAKPMKFNRRIAHDIPALQERMKGEVRKVKEDYMQGKYKNKQHALHVARQKSVGVLNAYYRETAEHYGYVYRTQK